MIRSGFSFDMEKLLLFGSAAFKICFSAKKLMMFVVYVNGSRLILSVANLLIVSFVLCGVKRGIVALVAILRLSDEMVKLFTVKIVERPKVISPSSSLE